MLAKCIWKWIIMQQSNSIVIGCSGNQDHIEEFVKELKENLKQDIFETEKCLKNRIDKVLMKLHKYKNIKYDKFYKVRGIGLMFYPEALIGAKFKDNKFCIFHTKFTNPTTKRQYTPDISSVIDYRTIGHGRIYADFILKQHNKINSLNNLDIITGLASYTINNIKSFDLSIGENPDIMKMDKNRIREISSDEQKEYYDKMIENLSNILYENVSDKDEFIEKIKNVFSYN